MSKASATAAALIAILLAAVVFAPAPGGLVWTSVLHDFAHGPIFGCVAVLLLVGLRRHERFAPLNAASQYAIALAGAAGLGLLSEIAQIPAGRDSSWSDLLHDVIGAVAFLALFALVDPLRRARAASWWSRGAALVVAVALFGHLVAPVARAAMQYQERRSAFPVLADFSDGLDMYFAWPMGVVVDSTPLPSGLSASRGEFAARVRFLPRQYAGLNFHEPAPDWRGYSTLAIELANPTDRALALAVRVHDAHHNNEFRDRYNTDLDLPAHTREVFRLSLQEIREAPKGRTMDMERIRGVVVFRTDESSADEMYVVKLWLE